MIFTSLTPLSRSSKRWGGWLLGWLVLGLLAAGCSKDPTSIGVGLPSTDANTGAYLIDTLTVRASTVLRDSVVTSSASTLLLGRYTDPQLGTVQATSYFGVGLPAAFVPDGTAVYDSLVLTLSPSSSSGTNMSFRYGDTTRTQSLVAVYKLNQVLPTNTPLFAAPRLTPLASYYDPLTSLLNLNRVVRQRRASPVLGTIRTRLNDDLGRQLMVAGQRGQLSTQDQLQALLPGLAIAPLTSDNAALLTFAATSESSALMIYYHDPTAPTVPQSATFQVQTGGAHCFQVELLNRNQSVLGGKLPTQTLGQVPASSLGEQTIIAGGIGLQTKLEFPYLRDLYQFGQHLTLTSAQLVLRVPPSSTSMALALAPPSTLNVSTVNFNNQPVTTLPTTVSYDNTQLSPLTTLPQATYTLPDAVVNAYIQAVLAGASPNNGLLLRSASPELPSRVLLGSSRNASARLQLRVYVVSSN